LPPIAVVERPDGYYVIDGRHRVSVARALGDDAIDAWATPAPPGPPAPAPRTTTTDETPMTDITQRVVHAIARTLGGGDSAEQRVHFHAGDDGRPYVCEDRRCSSPSLDPAAA
ncbi:MAG: ParB/Sulfiredoxin domain, partial [Solirubrobacteraceae bacterium]|nr:ParB/Sulfiredoxin domain [Solirubrobacteraceae bacterium]